MTNIEIAEKLGVHPYTVTRQGIRLGLKYPRNTRWACPITEDTVCHRKIMTRLPPEERLSIQRQKLLALINSNPKAIRSELQILGGYVLDWLRAHDPEWLESHLPPFKKKIPRPKVFNWAERDSKTAEEIEKAASSIMSLRPPVWISKRAIINETGTDALGWNLDKLPLTVQALRRCVEPFEDFLLRRVEWVAADYVSEKKQPSLNVFLKRAGATLWYVRSERVRDTIDEAMISFT